MDRFSFFFDTAHGRTFSIVWLGQLVSTLGSSMTRFGLAIWVFNATGSTMQLAFVVLAGAVPSLLLSPFVGALVDRWDRRTSMIVADAGAATGTLAIAVLLATGGLEMWHLYVALAIGSAFNTFQFPAYSAAVTLLVPKEQFARAAALVQLAGSIGRVAAPALAAVLVVSAGLGVIFAIDFVTFLVAVGSLLVVRFPSLVGEPRGAVTPIGLLSEAREGLGFVVERRGLLVLLATFSLVNFSFAFLSVLLVPLLLTLGSETITGLAVSISAIGLVAGSTAMTVWGGSRNRVRDLYVALIGMSAGLTLVGLRPWIPLVVVAITITHIAVPAAASSSQAIWQAKVPPPLQGRVFAIRQMFALGAMPAAMLIAGFLAERVFDPVVGDGSAVAWLVGVGPGRGIGLVLSAVGLMALVTSLLSATSRSIRELDVDVPDVMADAAVTREVVGTARAAASPPVTTPLVARRGRARRGH